jgi:hypothetical protein
VRDLGAELEALIFSDLLSEMREGTCGIPDREGGGLRTSRLPWVEALLIQQPRPWLGLGAIC